MQKPDQSSARPPSPHLPLHHVVLPLPALLPPSLLLPWSLSFSLTLPQSYIKSYQPLEEHIKVLGPVKSYKLSALQYHYMFHLPPTPPPPLLSLSLPFPSIF